MAKQPGGATRMARGGIRLVHGHTKKHPIHVFFRYENRLLLRVFACIFLNLSIMSFPKYVYMTKNTPFFSNFARFCTPKRCTCIQCLVLKNNPNYVNFWTSLIPPLDIRVPPPPPRAKTTFAANFGQPKTFRPADNLIFFLNSNACYMLSLWQTFQVVNRVTVIIHIF